MEKLVFRSLAAFAATAFCFAACQHSHVEEDDFVAPAVQISAPLEGASIAGDVSITGLATDDLGLHTLSIAVTKDSDGSVLLTANPGVHDEVSYSISEKFTPAGLAAETPVTLTAVATDHGENATTKTVHFKIKS